MFFFYFPQKDWKLRTSRLGEEEGCIFILATAPATLCYISFDLNEHKQYLNLWSLSHEARIDQFAEEAKPVSCSKVQLDQKLIACFFFSL